MKPKFKVGDRVKCINNKVWGNKPMVIVEIGSKFVICDHPDFKISGGFWESALIHDYQHMNFETVKKYLGIND